MYSPMSEQSYLDAQQTPMVVVPCLSSIEGAVSIVEICVETSHAHQFSLQVGIRLRTWKQRSQLPLRPLGASWAPVTTRGSACHVCERVRVVAAWSRHRPRLFWGLGGVLSLLVLLVGIGELMAWPWLARPIERAMVNALHRPVSLAPESGGGAPAVRVKLLGALTLDARRLEIADLPRQAGTVPQPLLIASDVTLRMRWRDVLGAVLNLDSGLMTVQALRASRLEVHAKRTADGLANWDFSVGARELANTSSGRSPRFESLWVDAAEGSVADEVLDLHARFSAAFNAAAVDSATVDSAATTGFGSDRAFMGQASGRWRQQPMTASLRAGSPLPLTASGSKEAVVISVRLDAGHTSLRFDGRVADLFGQRGLDGRYSIRGRSLAEVGQVARVTLPSTPPFDLQGGIQHATNGPAGVWNVDIARGLIGHSDFAGNVSFDARGIDPKDRGRLSGELRSRTLWLSDLGPAIGAAAPGQPKATTQGPERLLPQRSFDLPSLRAMDADVTLAVQSLRLDRAPAKKSGDGPAVPAVKPIEPLALRIHLEDGVLRLADIVAGLAQGRIEGEMTLDAKQPDSPANWRVRLNVRNVRIEQFVPAVGKRAVPWASGRVSAQLALDGRGTSTAELLASADGSISMLWSAGTVSHLAVEAMGLDVAEGIGRWLRGDKSLAVTGGAAYFRVKKGRAEPAPAVVDTADSTLWLGGHATLAEEQLDLSVHVAPKDRSLLTLRTPLVLRGSFLHPQPGLEGSGIAQKVLPSALLALVNPLAALLPLIDSGDREEAQAAKEACMRLAVGPSPSKAPQLAVPRKPPSQGAGN